MTIKIIHCVRLLAIIMVAGSLLFIWGWSMYRDQHRQKAIEAIKTGTTHEAALALAEWCSKDGRATQSIEYYVSAASIHAKNGNMDAVRHNLAKAVELMGK